MTAPKIRQFLDVPYQTVRNQLLRAGITTGLRRQVEIGREPLTVDVAPTPHPPTLSKELLNAKFSVLGEWTAGGERTIKLDAEAPTVPGVRAFVADDEVVYVGLTNNGLRARLEQCRIGHTQQKTNARIKIPHWSRLRLSNWSFRWKGRHPLTSSRIRAAFLEPMPQTYVKLSLSAVTTRSTEPNLVNSR